MAGEAYKIIPFSREGQRNISKLSPERRNIVEKLRGILHEYEALCKEGSLPSATEFNEARIVDLLLDLLSEKRKTVRATIVREIEQNMTSEAMEDSKHLVFLRQALVEINK